MVNDSLKKVERGSKERDGVRGSWEGKKKKGVVVEGMGRVSGGGREERNREEVIRVGNQKYIEKVVNSTKVTADLKIIIQLLD